MGRKRRGGGEEEEADQPRAVAERHVLLEHEGLEVLRLAGGLRDPHLLGLGEGWVRRRKRERGRRRRGGVGGVEERRLGGVEVER